MKKGFTLLELLGVIALLGLLMIISYPIIVGQIEKKQKEVDSARLELIYSGVESYIKEHPEEYPYRVGNSYCIPLDTVVNANKIAIDVSDVTQQGVQVNMGSNYNFVYRLVEKCSENTSH